MFPLKQVLDHLYDRLSKCTVSRCTQIHSHLSVSVCVHACLCGRMCVVPVCLCTQTSTCVCSCVFAMVQVMVFHICPSNKINSLHLATVLSAHDGQINSWFVKVRQTDPVKMQTKENEDAALCIYHHNKDRLCNIAGFVLIMVIDIVIYEHFKRINHLNCITFVCPEKECFHQNTNL